MSQELKERLFFTLAILAVARALIHIPLPGVNTAAYAEFLSNASANLSFNPSFFYRATIGALGISPYLFASAIVIFILYFRRFRHGGAEDGAAIEFYTVSLAGVIVVLQSYGTASSLESLAPFLYGEYIVSDPGLGFRVTTILSQTAGFFLLLWLAHLISQKGIGNGVCLMTFILLLDEVPYALIETWSGSGMTRPGQTPFMQSVLFIISFIAVYLFAILLLIGAKWQLPLKRSKPDDGGQPRFYLRINSVGVIGLTLAGSLLFIPGTLAVILPSNFPGMSLFLNFSGFGVSYWLTWGILTFFATYFWTAWAYRPSGLQRVFSMFPNRPEADSLPTADKFEGKLAIAILPRALGLPLITGGLYWVAQQSSLFYVLGASTLFPAAAISLDFFRPFLLSFIAKLAADVFALWRPRLI